MRQGSQFIVATYSPILLAVPNARILQVDIDGAIEEVDYDDAEPVASNPAGAIPHPSQSMTTKSGAIRFAQCRSVRGVQGGVQIAADQCSVSQHDLAY